MRQKLKRTIKNLFLLLALPLYAVYFLLSFFGNPDGIFQSFSQALSLIPGKLGIYIRAAFYRLACSDTSDDILVGFLTVFSHRDTSICKGVYIGPGCNIGKCTIGKNTLLGSGVHILSGNQQHNFRDPEMPIQEQGGEYLKIQIGEDCWIGNGAILLAGVGDKSIVAAGSVLTRPIEESGAIWGGNPAAKISLRQKKGSKC
ncbi:MULTISPECIES: acyltransferase [unclassified Marinobacter]|jgi:acetyltransferase-like isoleucine patch superfamily enzyme|uniref:acyltransferase n=1 Tax=unclassified Marinobacter TaxID=83889 RepID=UPI002010B596|nr:MULTISPECIES: acyltransferase [unclassified Marinobacter]UQG58228.1 acyltransferase [Marinobacter sp. M4C]UQG67034.1 acyltransferase [Marinobacter sp. M2C]UQG71313.1 acyltransferase [Marinobacter sp. M1C]